MRDASTRERRLEELRAEALERGQVSANGAHPSGASFPRATAEEGYYGLPLLKEPGWTWEVPLYLFLGGAAGASAVVGAAARLAGEDERLSDHARGIVALGGGLSTALLVSDLGRPARFLHMLRVFKPQSPMSVGAWTLTAFASSSAAAALARRLRRHATGRSGPRRPLAIVQDAGDALAALSGLSMACYTGVLLGATTVPAWNRSVRLLPPHFAAAGLGSAVGLLELLGHRARGLNRAGLAAALAETAIGAWHELEGDRALAPLKRGKSGLCARAGLLLSGPIGLGLRLFGRRRAAAASALAGSLLSRIGWMAAGKVSSRERAPTLDGQTPRELSSGNGSGVDHPSREAVRSLGPSDR